MPTTTFYNLTQTKREKLISAAKKEFSSTSYNEASINKIIKDAEIPRGSFYMYFQDKKDLFLFLCGNYINQIYSRIKHISETSNQDIFSVYIAFYDSTLEYLNAYKDEARILKNLYRCLHSTHLDNHDEISLQDLLNIREKLSKDGNIFESCNRENLKIKSEEDFEDLNGVLRSITKNSLKEALRNTEEFSKSRIRFINKINMVKYGVLNK